MQQFLEANKVIDCLPENAKIVVLNHELTLAQAIETMTSEQCVTFAVIWNSDRREFIGIITVGSLLELIIQVCESLDLAWQEKARNKDLCKDDDFLQYFIDFFIE